MDSLTKDLTSPVVITAFVAGFVAMLCDVAVAVYSQRLDTLGSGIIGSVPLYLVPCCIAFVLIDHTVWVVGALYAVPSGILLNAIFLTIWRILPPYLSSKVGSTWNIVITSIVSLSTWGLGYLGLFFALDPIPLKYQRIAAAVSSLIMLIYGIVMASLQSIPPANNQSKEERPLVYVLFAVFSFTSMVGSILITAVNETAGGLLTTFPSFFLLSMISYWHYQGSDSTGKTFVSTKFSKLYISHMILGSLAISVYAILFAEFYEFKFIETLGDIGGSAVANIISFAGSFFFVSLPMLYILKKMQQKAESKLDSIIFDDDEHEHLLGSMRDVW